MSPPISYLNWLKEIWAGQSNNVKTSVKGLATIISIIGVYPIYLSLTTHETIIHGTVKVSEKQFSFLEGAEIKLRNKQKVARVEKDGSFMFEAIEGRTKERVLLEILLQDSIIAFTHLWIDYNHRDVRFDTILTPKVVNADVVKIKQPNVGPSQPENEAKKVASKPEIIKSEQLPYVFGIVSLRDNRTNSLLSGKVKTWLTANGKNGKILFCDAKTLQRSRNEDFSDLSKLAGHQGVRYVYFLSSNTKFSPSSADPSLVVAYNSYSITILNVANSEIIDSFKILQQGTGLSEEKALEMADNYFYEDLKERNILI